MGSDAHDSPYRIGEKVQRSAFPEHTRVTDTHYGWRILTFGSNEMASTPGTGRNATLSRAQNILESAMCLMKASHMGGTF